MQPSANDRKTATKHRESGRKHLYIWNDVDRSASEPELRERYRRLKARGLTGVFIGGGIHEPEFQLIREAGLELHTWMWTTNRGDAWIREHHPDWYMVSRSGKSCFDHPPYVDYYRWVSPVIPGVQSYLKERVDELASHEAVTGVHLDYVRYPDVILPRALWAKYGLDQTHELPDYDFCYSPHTRHAFKSESGRDPLEIEAPAYDQEWLHFRYNSVTKLVNQLAREARRHQKKITAAVFPTPHMARKICRQDWDKWPLDAVCPMTYHSFYNEGVPWIGDCILENIQSVPYPVYAGLYMPDLSDVSEFRQAIQTSIDNGAAGVSLFGGVNDEHWAAAESVLTG
jgi:hypothetical protein